MEPRARRCTTKHPRSDLRSLTVTSGHFSSLSFNFDFPYDLGFRFDAPDGTHHGWRRLLPPGDIIRRAVITILHYNDTPGAPATVGSTIPEPSTFLLLAFPLLGTVIRRR